MPNPEITPKALYIEPRKLKKDMIYCLTVVLEAVDLIAAYGLYTII